MNLIKLFFLFYSGDCAIYTVKFIKLDMADSGLDKMSDIQVKKMRFKTVIDIFCNDWSILAYGLDDVQVQSI